MLNLGRARFGSGEILLQLFEDPSVLLNRDQLLIPLVLADGIFEIGGDGVVGVKLCGHGVLLDTQCYELDPSPVVNHLHQFHACYRPTCEAFEAQ